MSTYEDEHNLNNNNLESSNEQQQQFHNGQRHLTLQQALNNFLNIPTYSTNIINLNNENINNNNNNNNNNDNNNNNNDNNNNHDNNNNNDNNLPIEPHMLEMLQSMLQSVSNVNGIVTLDDINNKNKGVDDSFFDTLERVNIKKLKDDDACPICTNDYKNDKHPLVVELPCNSKHRFDLECIGPWLKLNKTCPLCRTDVTMKKKKEIPIVIDDDDDEEEGWDMYG
jgi:hypothetical protein